VFYLLFTEASDNLNTLASQHFDGYTMFQALGSWQGKLESSAVLLIGTDDRSKVDALARTIASTNRQETVMVLPLAGKAEFVSGD
jgi:hypothetical protein